MKILRYLLFLVFMLLIMVTPALAGPKLTGKTDILKLPEWKVMSSSFGGKLILSDSPEIVPGDGIMYQDKISGPGRLFFHHVNGTTVPKKIVVLLENTGTEAAHVTVYQRGLGGPGYDYLQVGKAAQMEYLADGYINILEVPAKGSKYLDYSLNDIVVEPNMLLNGIYDFQADKPVNVKVMMMSVNENVEQFARQAKVLPRDALPLRGTFEGRDRLILPNKVYNPLEDEMVALTLADDDVDPYLRGIDATDGSAVVNYGNYGVVYKVFIPSENKGKLSFYLNPRGGEYAGGIGIKYKHLSKSTVATPSDRTSFGTKITELAALGAYDGGQSLWLTFSPPGASNLPVKLIIVPQ